MISLLNRIGLSHLIGKSLNTSLAAKGALNDWLQHCTACNTSPPVSTDVSEKMRYCQTPGLVLSLRVDFILPLSQEEEEEEEEEQQKPIEILNFSET